MIEGIDLKQFENKFVVSSEMGNDINESVVYIFSPNIYKIYKEK